MHRGPLKTHRVPEEAVFDTEYLFRTVEACFEHRAPLKTPSVQKKGGFLHRMPFSYRRSLFYAPSASENASRTIGACFAHRMFLPYHRRAFPVPSAIEGVGKGSAGDKFRVSGTQETVEGAGANKESGVPLEASCCRCGTSNFTIEAGWGLSPDRVRSSWTNKERGRPFSRPLLLYRISARNDYSAETVTLTVAKTPL